MVYVAWWTGRGYSTILIVIASMIVFEVARAALNLPDGVWVFGLAMLGAAAVNWFVGQKLNRKSRAKVRSNQLRKKLLYRARHKFMSLPMETFSIIIAAIGVLVLVIAVAQRA